MKKIVLPRKFGVAVEKLKTAKRGTRKAVFLGRPDGVIKTSRASYIYTTDALGTVQEVFNRVVPVNKYGFGLPLWIMRGPGGYWQVDGLKSVYDEPLDPGLMEHADSHGAYGYDPHWIWPDIIMPWLVMPVAKTIKIYRTAYYTGSAWVDGSTETVNLASYIPASGALYLLIEINAAGTVTITEGTPAASREALSVADIPALTANCKPLCAVRLYAGMTKIQKNSINRDFYDLRFGQVFGSGGGGGGGTPGGADTQVQYNDGGAFAGDANLTWNKTLKRLYLESTMYFTKNGWFSAAAGTPGFYVADNWMALFFDDGGAQINLGTTTSNEKLSMRSGVADYLAFLETNLLTSVDRTFTFPDASGTLALGANADTLEPTGWVDPNAVAAAMTYDSSTRKISISGTHSYYWRGVKTSVTDFVSSAHTDTVGHQYYLSSSDGTTYTWATDSPWLFSDLQIAFVNYQTSNKWAIAESHGLMPYQVHEELHQTIGTYKESGGTLDPATYTLLSTTAANRRPDVLATHLHDEDIDLTLAELTSKTYNKFSLSGASTINFSGATADIVALLTNNPYYNSFSTPNWGQTLMANNSYMCVWLFAAPVTGDAGSQVYRYFWMQGQSNGNLASQQAVTPADLNFGTLATEATEFVALVKIIIRYTGGNWDLYSVTNISGSKFSQTGTAAGTFLSSVATDGSLAGDGHTTNPLSTASLETTATTAGTTTLLVSSATRQEFTGITTQTVVLPVVSTLRIGRKYEIDNNSIGVLTVNSSGGNLVQSMAAGSTAIITCILITGTGAASWDVVYLPGGIAPLASPTFTGVPAAPTAAADTNTTQLATTAYVLAQGADGWVPATAWTYVSASTFTVAGNQETTYPKGAKQKWTQTTVKYGVVLSSVYSAGPNTTLVTIAINTDYTIANAAISVNYYSRAAAPVGFPVYFNYTPVWSSAAPSPAIGNGSLTGKYQILSGGQYMYHIVWTAGASTTYGGAIWRFTLPISPIVVNTMGTLLLFDANTNTYYPGTSIEDATGKLIMIGAANTYFVGVTTPITFANGDMIFMTGTIFY
jgi:hypothetical protein